MRAARIFSLLGCVLSMCFAWSVGSQELAPQNRPPIQRRAYFGDLHLHTGNSFDANIFGERIRPEDAYKYAMGEEITYQGEPVKRQWPLDFLAVTDHAESLGVFDELSDPNSKLLRTELGREVADDKHRGFKSLIGWHSLNNVLVGGVRMSSLDPSREKSVWKRVIAAANRNYVPGRFTTFIGYEWSAQPNFNSLHRVVIFRDATAPNPFTAWDSLEPEDLWKYMENIRSKGGDVIAIPHNSNASDGVMFDWNDSRGRPIGRAYALRRAFNEPLVEIVQRKGQSETHPVLSPTDEFADFEINDYLAHDAQGLRQREKLPPRERHLQGGYVRDAYGRGLVIADRIGVNPYKFGVEAGSDLHNGMSNSQETSITLSPPKGESLREYMQEIYRSDPASEQSIFAFGSPGLTGVWAEQNTRESLFAAFRRKETFGTSGTRIKVHFFGGWAYHESIFTMPDWPAEAYAQGTAMGGDLPPQVNGATAPSFLVWALKDPDGANLDRAQVVKLWIRGSGYAEKVFDVAWSPGRSLDKVTGRLDPVGNTVDLARGSYSNSIGATELRAVWSDPEFDPAVATLYYVRVLEIPTPRWSTLEAAKAGLPAPANVAATIQERAWSSAVWYSPQRRKGF